MYKYATTYCHVVNMIVADGVAMPPEPPIPHDEALYDVE